MRASKSNSAACRAVPLPGGRRHLSSLLRCRRQNSFGADFQFQPERVRQGLGDVISFAGQRVTFILGEVFTAYEGGFSMIRRRKSRRG